jgi:geranylgeranyl pyrophosphate synthase
MPSTKVQFQLRKLLKEEGTKGWNLARKELQTQKTSSRRLREALDYIAELPDFFRPALVSLCSKAVGGKQRGTLPCSACLVLFGKSIGIHDDIIDDTKKRKKRLTAYGKFGKEIALVLSDVLAFEGFTLFRKNLEIGIPTQRISAILGTIEKVWFEQAEGEIFEVESRKRLVVSPEQCLAKIAKRASEFEAIARIGAILGGGTEAEIETLGKYGRMIGTASLLRDELIDMLEFHVLKDRIVKESLPLPIIYALEKPEARAQLLRFVNKDPLTVGDLRKISRVSDEEGGLSLVADHINSVVNKAGLHACGFDEEKKFVLIANSLRIVQADWRELVQP